MKKMHTKILLIVSGGQRLSLNTTSHIKKLSATVGQTSTLDKHVPNIPLVPEVTLS